MNAWPTLEVVLDCMRMYVHMHPCEHQDIYICSLFLNLSLTQHKGAEEPGCPLSMLVRDPSRTGWGKPLR